MNDAAELDTRDSIARDATVMHRAAPTSWEPHEVWLTRVKRPRDRAEMRLRENAAVVIDEL